MCGAFRIEMYNLRTHVVKVTALVEHGTQLFSMKFLLCEAPSSDATDRADRRFQFNMLSARDGPCSPSQSAPGVSLDDISYIRQKTVEGPAHSLQTFDESSG
jgi:hypothetical protein